MVTPRTDAPQVYSPENLNDALVLRTIHPDALVFAGGSHILSGSPGKQLKLPKAVISLRNVEELQRITRSERFIEMGSMVTLNQLLKIGGNVLPQVLTTALSRIANPAVRNIATVGGNLSVPDRRMTLFPVMHVLDARIELRRQEGTRWLPIGRFFGRSGEPQFSGGEILVRIRIPLTHWSVQIFSGPDQTVADDGSTATVCGVAEIQKDIVSDFRFLFCFPGTLYVRNRELEARVLGRKLPLSSKLVDSLSDDFRELLDGLEGDLSRFQREQSLKVLRAFLLSFPSE